MGENGELVSAADQFAIVRGPLPEHDDSQNKIVDGERETLLGTCSDSFEIIQNTELGKMLDPFADAYPLETVGCLRDGAKFFIVLKSVTESYVGSEPIVTYFTFVDSKIPGVSAMAFASPVCTVCQNTLTMSIKEASLQLGVDHRIGAAEEMQFYSRLMIEMAGKQDVVLQKFRAMAATPVDSEQIETVIKTVWPTPAKPRRMATVDQSLLIRKVEEGTPGAKLQLERYNAATMNYDAIVARRTMLRSTAHELIERFNDERTEHAGTVWGLYNACTELSDWREGRGYAESSLFGERAAEKMTAYDGCMELVELN
jgi:hypothetical protein